MNTKGCKAASGAISQHDDRVWICWRERWEKENLFSSSSLLSVWFDPGRGPVLHGGCTVGLLEADTRNLSRCFGAGRGLWCWVTEQTSETSQCQIRSWTDAQGTVIMEEDAFE